MFKGIKLVAIVMAVMVLIGTMMTPAHADYEKTATFEEKFEVLFDLYLKREGLEGYFNIDSIKEESHYNSKWHTIELSFTDIAIEDIVSNNDIDSNDVYGMAVITILEDYQYLIIATVYVDGKEYGTEYAAGENILEELDLI